LTLACSKNIGNESKTLNSKKRWYRNESNIRYRYRYLLYMYRYRTQCTVTLQIIQIMFKIVLYRYVI
jgi:hypothetical protein